jgi:hypothetical protein
VSGKSVLALAALAIAALALAWFNLARPWSFTVENRTYDGRFFRLDVKLSYKGEPHPISFVVGCKVHGVKYADGSRTRDVGLTYKACRSYLLPRRSDLATQWMSLA